MMSVPDAASVAACLWLESRLGRRVGPSTGTNLVGTLLLERQMKTHHTSGSIATLICDSGDRYAETIYDPHWRASQKLDLGYWSARFEEYDSTGGFEAMSSALEHGGLSVCRREMPFGDALLEI